MTFVSIIIPTYNRAPLVGRAVTSVLSQVRAGDEVIVVDDGSTDDTKGALAPFGERIRYLRTENAGAGAARNRGIRESGNPLVAFLDSDDEWMPGKLELQRRLMQARADILFSFSEFGNKSATGRVSRRCLRNGGFGWCEDDPRSWDDILGKGVPYSSITSLPEGFHDFHVHCGSMYVPVLARDYIYTSTVVVRREEAGAALRFAEDLPTFEDDICFARLSQKGIGSFLDIETAWNHGHAGPRLTGADELVKATTRIAIMTRVWGSDPEFLRQHGDLYDRILSQKRLRRIAYLLAQGRAKEARAEVRLIRRASLAHRLIVAFPGPVVRSIVHVRRRIRGGLLTCRRLIPCGLKTLLTAFRGRFQ